MNWSKHATPSQGMYKRLTATKACKRCISRGCINCLKHAASIQGMYQLRSATKACKQCISRGCTTCSKHATPIQGMYKLLTASGQGVYKQLKACTLAAFYFRLVPKTGCMVNAPRPRWTHPVPSFLLYTHIQGMYKVTASGASSAARASCSDSYKLLKARSTYLGNVYIA